MGDFRIGLTVGDPGGIGPEVIVKAIAALLGKGNEEYIIFSPPEVFERFRGKVWAKEFFRCSRVQFVPVDYAKPIPNPGEQTKEGGVLAYNSIMMAVEYAITGKVSSLVTAPISKYGIALAMGKPVGHTELLGIATNSANALMCFWGERLRIALLTTHVPLRSVATALEPSAICDKVTLLARFYEQVFDNKSPSFALLGLNPHSGENGVIGTEERDILSVAVERLIGLGIKIYGPFSADAFFGRRAYRKYDAVLAVYHDQGLIPFKMLEPNGVNVTLGLPFLRTSPSHGTAYDIAPRFVANPKSMIKAIEFVSAFLKKVR